MRGVVRGRGGGRRAPVRRSPRPRAGRPRTSAARRTPPGSPRRRGRPWRRTRRPGRAAWRVPPTAGGTAGQGRVRVRAPCRRRGGSPPRPGRPAGHRTAVHDGDVEAGASRVQGAGGARHPGAHHHDIAGQRLAHASTMSHITQAENRAKTDVPEGAQPVVGTTRRWEAVRRVLRSRPWGRGVSRRTKVTRRHSISSSTEVVSTSRRHSVLPQRGPDAARAVRSRRVRRPARPRRAASAADRAGRRRP